MSTISQNTLEGQRTLVTGAMSGIGRAVALQLARDSDAADVKRPAGDVGDVTSCSTTVAADGGRRAI